MRSACWMRSGTESQLRSRPGADFSHDGVRHCRHHPQAICANPWPGAPASPAPACQWAGRAPLRGRHGAGNSAPGRTRGRRQSGSRIGRHAAPDVVAWLDPACRGMTSRALHAPRRRPGAFRSGRRWRLSMSPAAEHAEPAPSAASPDRTGYSPFCSRRCADIDLGRWLKGGYAIPGSAGGRTATRRRKRRRARTKPRKVKDFAPSRGPAPRWTGPKPSSKKPILPPFGACPGSSVGRAAD